MMRIFLTGSKGQVGHCFRDRAPEDWELIASDSNTLDITNAKNVLDMVRTFKPDIILNTAAYTQVDLAEEQSSQAFAINAQGVLHLAQAAEAINARLVHLSTEMVFNGRQQAPLGEYASPDPVNIYGKSKLAGELLALAACTETLIMRTSWVFSEYGRNFVKTILTLGLEQSIIQVVDDQIGCPTYAGDLVEALIQTIDLKPAVRGIWHFSGQKPYSWAEFARQILIEAAVLDSRYAAVRIQPIRSDEYDALAVRPAYGVLNNQALRDMLPQPVSDTPLKQIVTKLLTS